MLKLSIRWNWVCAVLVAALVGGLWVLFSHWTASTWLAWPRFLLAVALLFLLPGWLLVRSLRLRARPLETLALSLVLGLIVACLLHALQTWSGAGWFLRFWALAGVGYAFWRGKVLLVALRSAAAAAGPAHALLLLTLVAVWLPLVCLPFFYRNLAGLPDGGMSYADIPDIQLHASIIAELVHTIPPRIPFLAGESLNYHVGMDLVGAVLHQQGGVAIMDWMVRFGPTFFLALAVLAIFVLARRFTGSALAGVATAALVMLGEDLAFIFGLLDRNPGLWCADYFGAPTIVSLYFFNPMTLAVALLFLGLLAFQRVLAGGRWGWSVVTALCVAALIQTKLFVFVQLVLAAGLVTVVALLFLRRRALLVLLLAVAVASAPLALIMAFQNSHGATFAWTWNSGFTSYVASAFRTHGGVLLAFPPLAIAAYLALTFGLRLAGLGALLKAFRLRGSRLFALLLALFVVLGPLLTLTSRIAPSGLPLAYDNAIWFLVASKNVAWLFAVAVLARCWRRAGRLTRAGLVAGALLLTLPGTIQFMVQEPVTFPLKKLSPATVEAVTVLGRTAAPGAVVFSTLNGPILAATPLHVPLALPYAASFISSNALAARTSDYVEFQNAWRAGTVRADLLARYHADWMLMPRDATGLALQTALTPVFTNQDYLLYRVAPPR